MSEEKKLREPWKIVPDLILLRDELWQTSGGKPVSDPVANIAIRINSILYEKGPHALPRPPSIEDQIHMMVIRSQCEPRSLANYRAGIPHPGPIAKGLIFEWEPDRAHACETCEVTKISADGESIWTIGTRTQGIFRNDMSRFREAAVTSLLRFLPPIPPTRFGAELPRQ